MAWETKTPEGSDQSLGNAGDTKLQPLAALEGKKTIQPDAKKEKKIAERATYTVASYDYAVTWKLGDTKLLPFTVTKVTV